MRICEFEGCEREQHGANLCGAHYSQFKARGRDKTRLEPLRTQVYRYTCEFPECGLEHASQGLCSTHYAQFRARGRDRARLTPIRGGGRKSPTCTGPECSNIVSTRGLCSSHIRVLETEGKLRPIRKYVRHAPGEECCYPGCRRDAIQKHLCKIHHKLWYNYRMTREDIVVLFKDPTCEVCGSPSDIHVDHDHSCCPGRRSCGKCVRGLLCSRCNTALGLLKEDEGRITALVGYIQKEGTQ